MREKLQVCVEDQITSLLAKRERRRWLESRSGEVSAREVLDRVGMRVERSLDLARDRLMVEGAVLYRLFVLGESQRKVAGWCRDRGGVWLMSMRQIQLVSDRAKSAALNNLEEE